MRETQDISSDHRLLLWNIVVECWSYDSITVSSTWELTSVSMRYSQGDGVHTPCLGLYCTHVSFGSLCASVFSCVILHFPRHGHVLTGTIIIKIMCKHQLYLQG